MDFRELTVCYKFWAHCYSPAESSKSAHPCFLPLDRFPNSFLRPISKLNVYLKNIALVWEDYPHRNTMDWVDQTTEIYIFSILRMRTKMKVVSRLVLCEGVGRICSGPFSLDAIFSLCFSKIVPGLKPLLKRTPLCRISIGLMFILIWLSNQVCPLSLRLSITVLGSKQPYSVNNTEHNSAPRKNELARFLFVCFSYCS